MISKKALLVVLDGFGINDCNKANPLYQANTPYFDEIFKKDYAELEASEKAVGLPV